VRTDGPLSGVRAIAFDAVGTLIVPDPPVAAVYHTTGRRYGSRLPQAEIGLRFGAAFRAEEDSDRATGWRTDPVREAERWQRIVGMVLDDVTDREACFQDLWHHFASPTSWRCLLDAGAVLAELSRRGFAVGLASNFDGRLRAVAAGLPELRPIGPVIVSAEVGWRKPAKEFFDAVVQAFDCAPNEVLLIGDDYQNDYVGAKAAGLRAVLLGDDINSLTELVLDAA
jgi:putative hydrolase of the HAD superfamily